MKSTLIKSVLWIGIILLAYFGLYGNITNEIHVRKVMDERKEENIQRLKDLREIQLEYKRQNGNYTNNADSLTHFLFNTKIKYINSEAAENDSIPVNMSKWKSIQNRLIKDIINPKAEAKRIYAEAGGEWTTLSEKQKINKGYIAVDFYIAHQLAFTTEYNNTRNNSFKIDVDNLNNISKTYQNQNSYNNFKSDFNSYSDDVLNSIKLKNIYKNINSNFVSIFDLDTNSSISTKELTKLMSENKKEIKNLKNRITENNDNKENAEGIIRATENQRNTYTESIGEDMITKVREKAKSKAEKGKKIKGRKGIIYSIIAGQDSTEKANNEIVTTCNNNINQCNNEIKAREILSTITKNNIQTINDVKEMQIQFARTNNTESSDFESLKFYTLNEEIKIVTTLKKGTFTTPTLPKQWKQAQLKAEFLVEQSLDEEMLNKIRTSYLNSGGKWRDLTEEEGYARGLIITIVKSVGEVIFDESYFKNRMKTPLNMDSLIYIPHSTKMYDFAAKEIHPNFMEQSQGEIDKYFFKISASYDDIFEGLDEEEKMLRKNNERGEIQVGSLEKTITNGNWGE